jgi:hypothetical protein
VGVRETQTPRATVGQTKDALDLAVLRAVLEQRGGNGHLFDVNEVVEEIAGQVAIFVQRVHVLRDTATGCAQQPFVLILL